MKPLRDLDAASRAGLLAAPTLTLSQAAAVIGVGETALRTAITRGEIALPVVSVGRRRIIPSAAVRRLLGIEDG